jgi:hypothetical protein
VPVISDLYSSKHLKPADLGGRPATVTIKDVTVEAFQNDGDNVRKAVLQFDPNIVKPLVVNKTNYLVLSHAFGANTDAWIGRQIILSPSMTPFKGKMVETIRVEPMLNRVASPAGSAGEQPSPEDTTQHRAVNGGTVSASVLLNDEIPKHWR